MTEVPEGSETPDPLPGILTYGSLNLLAGASGIGKSAFIAWMATQFRDGLPIFGHPSHPPAAIGYFTADRPWAGTKHWWAGVGYPDVRHASLVDDRSITLPQQRNKHQRVSFLKECVARLALPPRSLLIVDPIALFLGGNLLDYDSVAFACIQIHRWLQEPGQQYCVIGICHTAKQKADKGDRYLRLQDRILGTGGQLGYTGTQMYLAAPEETGDKHNQYTFLWNPHTAPTESFQLRKSPTTGLFLIGPQEPTPTEAPDVTQTERQVYELLAPPPAFTSSAAIIMKSDISRAQVFRLLKDLQLKGFVEPGAMRGTYRPTGKALPALTGAGESPLDFLD